MTAIAKLSVPVSRWIARIDRQNIVPLALLLVVLVGMGDYASGAAATFTLLYVFPIALGTWYRGRSFGIVLAGLSTIVSAPSNPNGHPLVMVWNAIGSFGIFLVIVSLLVMLRAYVERERNRLHVAVEQLRHAERLNVIGTLAAGVAHEVGTPLSVITLSARRLDHERSANDRTHQLTRSIVAQANKISAIVRHLLEFGRRGSSERAELELAGLARSTIELVATAAHRYRCRIELADETEVHVQANASELEQVLSNLLLNAMQAMPGGGVVRVGVATAVRRAVDGSERSVAAVSVTDEGTGIAEADLPHIFDPFFTTKPAGEGTGLGLSVSYGIVADHGGTIEVQSQRGRGTTFTVLLPLARAADGG